MRGGAVVHFVSGQLCEAPFIRHFELLCLNIRPKNIISMFPVSLPTLIFALTLKILVHIIYLGQLHFIKINKVRSDLPALIFFKMKQETHIFFLLASSMLHLERVV